MNKLRSGLLLLVLSLVFSMAYSALAQNENRRGRVRYHPEIIKPEIVKPKVERAETEKSKIVPPQFERSKIAGSQRERSRVERPAFDRPKIEKTEYADNFPHLYTRPLKPEPVLEPAPLPPRSDRGIIRSDSRNVRGANVRPARPTMGSRVSPSRPVRKHVP